MTAVFAADHKYSAALKYDLFTVEDGAMRYYGGSQNIYATPREKSCGCGIAGAADIILYIEAVNSEKTENYRSLSFSKAIFLAKSEELRKKYIPIIPGRGVNSFLLAMGMNKYFRKHRMKYRASWKWTASKKWEIVERMLKDDIPVIISIGNNFPAVWGKHELNLYVADEQIRTRHNDGSISRHTSGDAEAVLKEERTYRKQASVCGHFVVITAIEGNCLTVSSWGRRYYISIDEFDRYVKKHSTHIYSNILEIKRLG